MKISKVFTSFSLIFSVFTVFFIYSCGGGGNSSGSSQTPVEVNDKSTTKTGIIKVKFVKNTVSGSSVKKQGKTVLQEGKLIATPDKIRFVIDNSLKIKNEDIEVKDGYFIIKNVPPSSNASITFISEDNKEGITIDDITVKEGETTDLGEVEVKNLHSFNILIQTHNHEKLIVLIPDLDFRQEVTPNVSNEIKGIPEGSYFCAITDLNGNVLFAKYLSIPEEKEVKVTLDDFIHSGTLEGTVVDSSGRGIPNALVMLKPSEGDLILTLTDNNGHFKIDKLVKGVYTVFIKKEKFLPKEIPDVNLNELYVNLGKIKLMPANTKGSLIGYVYLPGEEDNSGVIIGYEKIGDSNNISTNAYTSKRDGAFVIKNLEEGEYYININPTKDYLSKKVIKVSIVRGTTKIINEPIVLERLTATIQGTLKLSSSINPEDLTALKIDIIDKDNNVLSSYSLTNFQVENNEIPFKIKNVPVGLNGYTLKLYGKDKYGNDISVKTIYIDSLSPEQTYSISEPITVEYVDPNPPEITILNVKNISATDTKYDELQQAYIVNPGDRLNIDVYAQDKDGDPIQYFFESTHGKWISIDSNSGKATYESPHEGGSYTITIRAKSQNREDVKSITLLVNHYPSIVVNSPSESEMTKDTPKEFSANEEVIINTTITDFEDTFEKLKIKWYSDAQGLIAENTQILQKVLIPGLHKISLVVEDTSGLKTEKIFYVKVNPIDIVWLKEPDIPFVKLYTTVDGILLDSTYQIPRGTSDKTLNYESLDKSVATVDRNGLIRAVKSGTTKIRVYSSEVDENGNPLYEYFITVRVIGDLNKEETKEVGIGQIKQLRISTTNGTVVDTDGDGCFTDEYVPVKLKFPYQGKYEIVVFDRKEVISESYVNRWVFANGGPAESNYSKGTVGVHQVHVLDTSDDYELRLYPHIHDHYRCDNFDLYVKIAVFPSYKIAEEVDSSASKYIAWDSNLEPNNLDSTAYNIQLSKSVESDLNIFDFDTVDWYVLRNIPKGIYTLTLDILSGTDSDFGSLFVEVYDSSGVRLANGSTGSSPKEGDWLTIIFDAKQQGDYKIKIFRNKNHDTYYRFIVYPSLSNGLVQDTEGEPNDTFPMATPITTNIEIEGSVNIKRNSDAVDWYVLRNLTPDTYTLILDVLSGTDSAYGKLHVKVYNPSGTVIKEDLTGYWPKEGDWLAITFDVKQQGDYKIEIYRDNEHDTYYKFVVYPSLSNGLVQDAEGEPNDTSPMATPINLNEEVEGSINITRKSDGADWYVLKNLRPDTYTFTLDVLSGTDFAKRALYIEVYGPSGDNIKHGEIPWLSMEEGASVTFTFDARRQGDYKIKIHRENNHSTYYRFVVTSGGLGGNE